MTKKFFNFQMNKPFLRHKKLNGTKSLDLGRVMIVGFEGMGMFKKGQLWGICSVRDEVEWVTRCLSYLLGESYA